MLQIALSIESRDFLIFSYIFFSFSLSAKTGCQCFWNGRGWFARFPIGMPNYLKPFTQYKLNMVNNFLQFLLYKIIKTCAFLLVIRSQINKFLGSSIKNVFFVLLKELILWKSRLVFWSEFQSEFLKNSDVISLYDQIYDRKT